MERKITVDTAEQIYRKGLFIMSEETNTSQNELDKYIDDYIFLVKQIIEEENKLNKLYNNLERFNEYMTINKTQDNINSLTNSQNNKSISISTTKDYSFDEKKLTQILINKNLLHLFARPKIKAVLEALNKSSELEHISLLKWDDVSGAFRSNNIISEIKISTPDSDFSINLRDKRIKI